MTKPTPYDVIIAGAGIGGLFAALALNAQGLSSCVLERRTNPREHGAGIQLGPNANKLLEALGLTKAIQKTATRVETIHARDGLTGATLSTLAIGDMAIARHGAPHLTIHRADLHTVLMTSARKARKIDIHQGQNVIGYDETSENVIVKTKQGIEFSGSYLVCADGAFSNLRQKLLGDGQPVPAGLIAWRALIDPQDAPVECQTNETGLWMAPDCHLVHYRVRSGTLLNVVAMTSTDAMTEAPRVQGWSTPGDKAELARAFAGAAKPVTNLIAGMEHWYSWPLFQRPPAQYYAKGRIILLGDAAHPTLPCLAQGAAMAIEDGFVLAQCLARNFATPDTIAQHYNQARVARTGRLQLASRKNAGIYHASNARRFARNLVLRFSNRFAPKKTMQRYDWLYQYDPANERLDSQSDNVTTNI